MRKIPWIAALLVLSGCEAFLAEDEQPVDLPPGFEAGDVAGFPIRTESAEPVWRDQISHTDLPQGYQVLHPSPSRDGSFFTYATTEFGPYLQIAMRATLGAVPRQLTNGRADHLFPRPSPDGKSVAFASNRDGNWDIFAARIDAPTSVSQITFDATDEVAPSWAPDGKRLAYCTLNDQGVWQIVLVDVASRIKTYLGAGMYPDWSPDEKDPWIAFQSQPRVSGGRSGIRMVRPDGTGLKELVSDKASVWSAINPRFSPDGRWVAYATVQRSGESQAFGAPDEADDIWVVRPDGTLDMRLTDDLAAEWWPAWGRKRVFFVSARAGAQNIFSIEPKPLEDTP